MFLAPDEALGGIYKEVEARIRYGAAIGFSHGLAIHFGLVRPRHDLDVIPGRAEGSRDGAPLAVPAGQGHDCACGRLRRTRPATRATLALAYGKAIGCARAGLIASSFAEECEADLFNEGAVVWGAVPEILIAGFETLVEAGISPEVAFLECVGELKLIAELIEQRGIAGMREAISNTAELGAVLGGPRVVDDDVRQQDARGAGRSAQRRGSPRRSRQEADAGYPLLEKGAGRGAQQGASSRSSAS